MTGLILSYFAGAASGIGGMITMSVIAWKQRNRIVTRIAARPVRSTWADIDAYTTPED